MTDLDINESRRAALNMQKVEKVGASEYNPLTQGCQ